MGQKVRKSSKKVFPNVWKFQIFGNFEISENYKKMTLNLKFENPQKTRSDSKTDSKVRLKVRNAGP